MGEKMLDVTEAASHFAELIDRTSRLHEVTILVENGKPVARVTPVDAPKTTDEFLNAWPGMHHLSPQEAADFEADILDGRKNMPPLRSQWD